VEGDNGDDNKDEEEAYGHLVDVAAGVDVDTYMEHLQEVHLEDDPVDVAVGDMDSLQQLGESVGTVVGLLRMVADGEHTVEEDALM